jgi:Ni/Co efflux regulator RcnB
MAGLGRTFRILGQGTEDGGKKKESYHARRRWRRGDTVPERVRVKELNCHLGAEWPNRAA